MYPKNHEQPTYGEFEEGVLGNPSKGREKL